MTTWEYLFFKVNAFEGKVSDPDSAFNREYLFKVLPKLGADGWEMVAVVPLGDSLEMMYFKRVKQVAASRAL